MKNLIVSGGLSNETRSSESVWQVEAQNAATHREKRWALQTPTHATSES
jgi:hypothetical protein